MKLLCISILVALSVADTANAQKINHTAECDKALSQSVLFSNSSASYDWRLATLVTQEQWTEKKTGTSASAVIYGIPIGATFDDFQKNVQSFYAAHNESLSIANSRSIAWQGLENANVEAYKACLNTIRNNAPGLYISADKATKDTVSLTLFYNAGAHDKQAVKISWQDDNQLTPADRPTELVRSTEVSMAVKRPQSGSAFLVINAKGVNGDTIEIAAYPPLPPPLWELRMGADDTMSCQINGLQIATVGWPGASGKEHIPVSFAVHPGNNSLTCLSNRFQT